MVRAGHLPSAAAGHFSVVWNAARKNLPRAAPMPAITAALRRAPGQTADVSRTSGLCGCAGDQCALARLSARRIKCSSTGSSGITAIQAS